MARQRRTAGSPRLNGSPLRLGALFLFVVAASSWVISERGFRVTGYSMSCTLLPGDRVLIAQQPSYKIDDVVVFEHWQSAGTYAIKRIVGGPGALMTVRDGRLYRDDRLVHGDRTKATAGFNGKQEPPPWRPSGNLSGEQRFSLGDDEYFLLGDRVVGSGDSRKFGPISSAQVVGRAWIRLPRLRPTGDPRCPRVRSLIVDTRLAETPIRSGPR